MKYFLPENDETIEDAREITGKFIPNSPTLFAESVASYMYSNGWHEYDDWPVIIAIADDEGIEVGRFKVSIDYDPNFYAEEVK